MSIKKISEFPIVTESWKIFFCEKAGPVLIMKQDRDEEFSIQFILHYQGVRIDETTSWTARSNKSGQRDPDKEEIKRNLVFQNIDQEYAEKVAGSIIKSFFDEKEIVEAFFEEGEDDD